MLLPHAVDRCVDASTDWFAKGTSIPIRLLVTVLLFGATIADGQGPGTLPPPGMLQESEPWPEELEGIRPDAFLFQDESNTPVVMPRMSFEEIDRLRRLDRNGKSGDQIATLDSLSIVGTMGHARAQWEAELTIRLDGVGVRETVGRSVVADIGFAGAHLLRAAEIRFPPLESAEASPTSDLIPDAYVRLTPSELPTQVDANVFRSNPVTTDNSGELEGRLARSTTLPQGFPAELRQAMIAGGDDLTYRDRGYQLVLPIEPLLEKLLTPRSSMVVKVHLPFSARVWATPQGQSWLPLNLPTVSALIQMELDDANDKDQDATLLDVVGSGREVVRQLDGGDRYAIECDGGVIALHVSGATDSHGDTGDLIEVESETQLQWESPTEPPTMDVRLVTKNLRGPLRGCEIRLPVSSVLVSPPEIISSNNEAKDVPGVASGAADSAWWEIVIARASETVPSHDVNSPPDESNAAESPAKESLTTNEEPLDDATRIVVRWVGADRMQAPSSVSLRLQIRQFPSDATATDPWVLRIPQVTDAIGHRGQVTIRTASDHRLRWRPRMGIDAVVAKQSIATSGELVYPFRFTQTRFELPIWLSRKQQQTRLTADANLTVTRRAARVEIDVQAGGVGIDPKGLRLELGQWRLLGIKTEIPDTELDVTTTDGNVEWQVNTSDGKWPVSFQISAELTAPESPDSFGTLTLPRLVSTDSSSVLRDVRLSLADDRRETWLVDLAGSPALQRIPGQSESSLRFLIPESPWTLNGSFATRPLELLWTGEASAVQSSDDWVIRSLWSVTSQLDLEGRLRFSVPTVGGHYHSGESSSPSTRVEPSPDASKEHADPQRWTALVDGYPATIRGPLTDSEPGVEFADRDLYEIVSPYLDVGVQRVELAIEQPILPADSTKHSSHDDSLQSDRGEIHGLLAVPVPAADRVELLSPVKLTVPFGVIDSAGVLWRVLPDLEGSLGDYVASGGFQVSSGNSIETSDTLDTVRQSDWTFRVIPDFPISFVVRSRLGEEKLTEIPRAFLRSLVGKQFRHEQLIAAVRGGRRVRLGLPPSLQTLQVEVMLDGHPVEYTRDASELRVDLPEASERAHLLDVRIWVEELNNPWWSRIEPLIRLPVGSGLQYWQLAVPTDSHLFWASNQSGRAMRWQRDGLKVSRMPAASDSALIRWALDLDWQIGNDTSLWTSQTDSPDATTIAVSPSEFDRSGKDGEAHHVGEDGTTLPRGVPDSELRAAMRESMSNATFAVPGNRYLFFAGNVFSFAAITVSRTVLWLAVGGLVLVLATAVQWFPRLHHSVVAFLLAIALAGLLVIAPDGVILTAQLVVISLTLVAVFYAISAVATPRGGQRVLPPRAGNRDSVVKRSGSSQRRNSRGNERVVSTPPAVTPTSPRSHNESDEDQQVTREFDAGHSPVNLDEDMSLVPSTNPAAQVVEGSPAEASNEVSPEDSSGVYHARDSHSDSDSSEALR